MPVNKIGMNLSNLENIQPINISINTSGPKAFLTEVITTANTTAGGYLGHFMLIGIFALLFFSLTDLMPFAEFRYGLVRGTSIALGITTILGIVLVQAEFIYSLNIVGTFFATWVVSLLVVSKVENK